MDVSREFFCPRCKRSLTMSDQMHMMALVHRGGGSYIAFGDTDTVTCPACRCEMKVQDIIAGKYGPSVSGGIFGAIGAFAMIGGLVYLIYSCST